MRVAQVERATKETKVFVKIDLDGTGEHKIDTKIGFFNHMLELFSVHSQVDMQINCSGDTFVDFHHSVEDVGICLGQAFKEALGDKRGISRFADRILPMDECAVICAIDISARPYLNIDSLSGKIGDFDAELVEEFMRAFTFNAGINAYFKVLSGGNMHHTAEALFKALAKCIGDAIKVVSDKIPSSKGVL